MLTKKDPYSLVKKGEMRLPGAAYEALNADRKIQNTIVGPSVISGSKEEILDYLITGGSTTNKQAIDIMDEGTEMHEEYEQLMLKSGKAISIEGDLIDEANGIKGKYDVLLKDNTTKEGRAVMDIKTVGQNVFEDVRINGVKEKNRRQVNYYLGLMGLSKGYVQYVNRDNPDEMLTYDFQFDKSMYDDTLNNLQKARSAFDKMIKKHQISPYENYSDFEKFRILADVSPGSAEYNKYKSLVQANLQDYQEEEYKDILDRVNAQNKNHRFSPYVFTGVKTSMFKGTIQSVTPQGVKIMGSDKVYEIAGIEEFNEKVNNYLKPGLEVMLEINSLQKNTRKANAIFYSEGNNINRQMMKDGVVNRVNSRDNAMDVRAGLTSAQIALGKPLELISHYRFPFFHNKFMKVESPYESWLDENVYGSKYQTWDHPIATILKPSFQKDWGSSVAKSLIGAGLFAANEILRDNASLTARSRYWLDKAFKMVTPGAFTGFMTEGVMKLNWSDASTKTGARIGAVIGLAGAWNASSQNPFISAPVAGMLGHYAGEWLQKGWGAKGAAIGTAASLLVTAAKTDFNPKKMFSKWIPKDTEKRWEIEEYFDRIKYVKYKGLYERAASLARRKDGVNIEGIINKQENREKNFASKVKSLVTYKQRIHSGVLNGTDEGNYYNDKIESNLNELIYEQEEVPATPYVRAALAYKQAMESTVYSLDEESSYTQMLRALEPYERDYFLEFMKTTDPKERKKILKVVSPYKQKILQNAWGMGAKRTQNNATYFQSHKLPGFLWDGWSNDTDIEKIKMKTIENEGLQLSDFGYYDSAKQDIDYHSAQPVNFDQSTNVVALQANLLTAMNGIGLTSSDVSIEPSSQRGFQVFMNIGRIADHKIKSAIGGLAKQIL